MLVTLADQCDHKLMQYRDEEKTEIKKLKDEKKSLLDKINQLKQDKHSLQVQVDKVLYFLRHVIFGELKSI
jgi:hypothetical protein